MRRCGCKHAGGWECGRADEYAAEYMRRTYGYMAHAAEYAENAYMEHVAQYAGVKNAGEEYAAVCG